MKYHKGDLIRYNVRVGPPQICVVIESTRQGLSDYYIVLDLNNNERKVYYAPFIEDPTSWVKVG
jgi:hypothetical protein